MSGDRVASLIGMALGLYWAVMGFIYGFWKDSMPASGFIPVIFGFLTALLSGILFWQTFQKQGEVFKAKELRVVGLIMAATAAAILLLNVLGTMLTLGIFIVTWLRGLERYSWLSAVKVSVGTIAVAYLVFTAWLQVPLPVGLLGF